MLLFYLSVFGLDLGQYIASKRACTFKPRVCISFPYDLLSKIFINSNKIKIYMLLQQPMLFWALNV